MQWSNTSLDKTVESYDDGQENDGCEIQRVSQHKINDKKKKKKKKKRCSGGEGKGSSPGARELVKGTSEGVGNPQIVQEKMKQSFNASIIIQLDESTLHCTRELVAGEPRRPPMTDVGTESAFRLDQREHFQKSKHLLRSEVS